MHILLKNESMPQQMGVCVIFLFQHRYSLTLSSRIVDTTVDVVLMLSATLIMVWPGFVNCARIIHQFGIVTIMILDMLGQQTVSLAARNISRRLESRWIYSISLLDYSKSQINIWYFELVMKLTIRSTVFEVHNTISRRRSF